MGAKHSLEREAQARKLVDGLGSQTELNDFPYSFRVEKSLGGKWPQETNVVVHRLIEVENAQGEVERINKIGSCKMLTLAQFKTAFQFMERLNEISSLRNRANSSQDMNDRNVELECPICFEAEEQVALTCCNQAICKKCFKKLQSQERDASCPACRSTISFQNYDSEGQPLNSNLKKDHMWELLDILYTEDDLEIHMDKFQKKLEEMLTNSREKMELHRQEALRGDTNSSLGTHWDSMLRARSSHSSSEPTPSSSIMEDQGEEDAIASSTSCTVSFATRRASQKCKLCRSCQRKVNKEWHSLTRKERFAFRLAWMKQKLQYSLCLPKEAKDTISFKEDRNSEFIVVDVEENRGGLDLSFPSASFIEELQQGSAEVLEVEGGMATSESTLSQQPSTGLETCDSIFAGVDDLGSSSMSESVTGWACGHCTLVNPLEDTHCECCGYPNLLTE